MKNSSIAPAIRRGLTVLVLLVFGWCLGAAVAAAPAVAAHALGNHLHADLTIGPGKQFLLGGSQQRAFKVAARNTGKATVEIRERLKNGAFASKGTLRPGQSGTIRFAAASAAVLLNASASPATLNLDVTGDAGSLRMATEPGPAVGADPTAPRLTGAELSAALADDWRGTLTYRDYRSQQPVTLNTTLRGQMNRPDRLYLRFDYEEPNKIHVFGTDTLTVAPGGTRVRWDGIDFAVRAKQWLPGQTLRLVLEGQGRDDNRPATIRKTVVLSNQQFTVRKQVRFAADTAFVQRNLYQFTR